MCIHYQRYICHLPLLDEQVLKLLDPMHQLPAAHVFPDPGAVPLDFDADADIKPLQLRVLEGQLVLVSQQLAPFLVELVDLLGKELSGLLALVLFAVGLGDGLVSLEHAPFRESQETRVGLSLFLQLFFVSLSLFCA